MQPFCKFRKAGARHEVKLRRHITVTRIPTRPERGRKVEGGRERNRKRKRREREELLIL